MARMERIDIARLGAALLAAALLGGCGGFSLERLNPWSAPAERAQSLPPDATAYACDGGKRLVVRYLSGGENSVMIVFPEREFRLDRAQSGPGVRYTNGTDTLHAKGDEATFEEAGTTTYANCKKAAG